MTDDERRLAMRGVARDPVSFAAYLADMQQHLRGLHGSLELLLEETRAELRATHVAGDRRYHAPLRVLPVERRLRAAIKDLESATEGIGRAVYRRRVHDDLVKSLPAQRALKALNKANKKAPQNHPVNGASPEVPPAGNSGYSGPTSIFDMKRSA
ncbi:hypothetical protein [Streptomyces sp. NRRL B-24484]|uniref:hypothetical protein n=1 Tax=Streptomyces sp. NRRL B-24484 TaxID=1463833 RepID=UPI0004BFF284|nr:hypothetical protein [Streptomyces sp. NRRL B-24484]